MPVLVLNLEDTLIHTEWEVMFIYIYDVVVYFSYLSHIALSWTKAQISCLQYVAMRLLVLRDFCFFVEKAWISNYETSWFKVFLARIGSFLRNCHLFFNWTDGKSQNLSRICLFLCFFFWSVTNIRTSSLLFASLSLSFALIFILIRSSFFLQPSSLYVVEYSSDF